MNGNNKFYIMSREEQLSSIEKDIRTLREKMEHIKNDTEYNGCQNDGQVGVVTDNTMFFLDKMSEQLYDLHKTFVGIRETIKESDKAIKEWHKNHR